MEDALLMIMLGTLDALIVGCSIAGLIALYIVLVDWIKNRNKEW